MTSRITKKARIYAAADVAKHNTSSDMWVTHKGIVYDISGFVQDHPGGDDVVVPYAGKDITEVMVDETEHVHSKSAFEMMHDFAVGRLVLGEKIVSDDWEATEDFHPDDTDVISDFERSEFLDLSKALIPQMWYANFSKEFYLEQVHQPRHVTYSAKMFPYPWLECFTLTPWYVVPSIWLPIASIFFYLSALQSSPATADYSFRALVGSARSFQIPPAPAASGFAAASLCWSVGCVVWTLLEYAFHRFLFHLDDYLPDKQWALMLHFLMHGVHHYLPMDGLRLVMPPVMFFVLEYPFTNLAHMILPAWMANGVIAGAFTFYVGYDCMHWALHHTKLPAYMAEMKKYHLAHHYKNFELGFGVTSKIWDIAFGTVLDIQTNSAQSLFCLTTLKLSHGASDYFEFCGSYTSTHTSLHQLTTIDTPDWNNRDCRVGNVFIKRFTDTFPL
ncbi:fatty acid-2 hydroxylase [Phaffia rhodozyma]|uniref:Fatty acid-2 hydroxylase n=1 Tax=Phaffia rhodozyma TaxID=264483 RepID=A0A0F7SLC0_PHARH|nr:fatty acid-2 hydroxylase [Phaffia rhodozyma]